MVLLLSCQEFLLIPVLWALGWQDGADLICLFFRWRTGEGVEQASYVLEVRRHLSQVGQLTLLPVKVAVDSGSGTNDSSSTGIFCLPNA